MNKWVEVYVARPSVASSDYHATPECHVLTTMRRNNNGQYKPVRQHAAVLGGRKPCARCLDGKPL